MSGEPGVRDYFDRARLGAAIAIIVAGVLAASGAALDWVAIEETPGFAPGFDFGDQEVEAPDFEPFAGIELRDGQIALAGGAAMALFGALLLVRARSGWAWLAFLASIVVGAIAIADYKGANDLTSSICRRMECQGDIRPGIGITLVAAAAVIGLIASVAGVAATPRRDEDA